MRRQYNLLKGYALTANGSWKLNPSELNSTQLLICINKISTLSSISNQFATLISKEF
jgi:hypothetical protein